MFRIGNFEFDNKAILAPMAGITSFGYRKFMEQFSYAYSVTEMVSAVGLLYGNKETQEYISFKKGSYPTCVQLFGSDPESIAKAGVLALSKNSNIDFFDINMGCPVNKVTKTGAGSALMKDSELCGEIVKKLKEATKKPVTAKIRLGWDDKSINYEEVIFSLENAGVDAIAIHARTCKELYSGKPHFEMLKDLKDKMCVPLIISGNISTLEDAINALEITKADAVMVARGGIGNPFLLKQINTYYQTGEKLECPSLKEQLQYCRDLAKHYISEKGEERAMRLFRGIAPKFFSGLPNSKDIRVKLSTKLETYDSLNEILKEIEDTFIIS